MSALAKHTPGPWKAGISGEWDVDTDSDSNSAMHVGPENGYPVAIVAVPSAFDMDETLDANAALIAAAPEMLDALQDAMEALAMCQPRTDHGARSQSAAMQKARVAIAKAKGELS